MNVLHMLQPVVHALRPVVHAWQCFFHSLPLSAGLSDQHRA